MRTWPAWPLLVLALAGCLQEAPTGDGAVVDFDPPAHSLEQHLILNRAGCEAVTAILLVNPGQAAKVLPPGFRAADAQVLFEGEVPTGKVPIFVSLMDCPENSTLARYGMAMVGIMVERPQANVDGLGPGGDEFNLYLTQLYVESKDIFSYVQELGWAVNPATLRMGLNLPPNPESTDDVNDTASDAAARGASKILDARGELFVLTSGAVVPTSSQSPVLSFSNWTIRAWHQTPDGMGTIEVVFTEDIPVGQGVCRFRKDSPIAFVSGYYEYCPPSDRDLEAASRNPANPDVEKTTDKASRGDSTLVANLPDVDVGLTINWYPGVSA